LLAENTCTANVYLDALQLFVLEETDDCEQKEEGAILFKQDSASALCKHVLRNVLFVGFPNRWTGTGGTTTWLPRSPDFLSMGSFCWGYKESP
jgi:hypothetical protein